MGPSSGIGLLLNGPVTTTGVALAPVTSDQALSSTFQTRSDGTAALTVDIQATLVPDRGAQSTLIGGANPPRDDSYASADWVTLATNTMAAGAPLSRIDTVAYSIFRKVRIRVTATAGTATKVTVWQMTQGIES